MQINPGPYFVCTFYRNTRTTEMKVYGIYTEWGDAERAWFAVKALHIQRYPTGPKPITKIVSLSETPRISPNLSIIDLANGSVYPGTSAL